MTEIKWAPESQGGTINVYYCPFHMNAKCLWSFLISMNKKALIKSKVTYLSWDTGSCKATVGSSLAKKFVVAHSLSLGSFWLLWRPDGTVKWRYDKSPLSYLRAQMEHSYPIPGTCAAFVLYSLGSGSGWRLDQRLSCFFPALIAFTPQAIINLFRSFFKVSHIT